MAVLDDEYKAHATYSQILEDFGDAGPFVNIRGAEARHIEALLELLHDFEVPVPPNQRLAGTCQRRTSTTRRPTTAPTGSASADSTAARTRNPGLRNPTTGTAIANSSGMLCNMMATAMQDQQGRRAQPDADEHGRDRRQQHTDPGCRRREQRE